jgi:hypothetical protein
MSCVPFSFSLRRVGPKHETGRRKTAPDLATDAVKPAVRQQHQGRIFSLRKVEGMPTESCRPETAGGLFAFG